jgi:hypothetical protein
MSITLTTSNDQYIDLAPPYSSGEGGVFMLWPGDSNGNHRVNGEDIMMINNLIGVTANSADYDPACDLNADGIINVIDTIIYSTNINKIIKDYPGVEGVDFDA